MAHRWRRALRWGAVVALFFAVQGVLNRDMASGPAPAIEGSFLDGSPASLDGLRGRPALVYFWASWCPICGTMEDEIGVLARDHAVITVAYQSGDAGEVARHVAERRLDWRVVPDPDGTIGAAYGIRGVPAFFVLGPDGTIHSRNVGFTPEWLLRLRLWLAAG
ncbi:putative suppressor for copper-sensitivity D [Methylococcus capsulatus str. Bath]|uniref:Putative suppressor for copper-sensitivity D n=1 Tax=Methylococcus capsulatus (strain ATCC 33009 / NCIMB 11132 / Bath) TaxID=243233 RepID=Q60BR2_METCA|nr:protein disulfide oxidoreductase [Methylococcus capsulatus]AAU90446.1 putative suppressor for copper-sensitivity D [Methylococcus capsulatus str. Bath]